MKIFGAIEVDVGITRTRFVDVCSDPRLVLPSHHAPLSDSRHCQRSSRSRRDRGRAAVKADFAEDLEPSGSDVGFRVGSDAKLVSEYDYLYSLYAVDVIATDGSAYRHMLVVPYPNGIASHDVGLALFEADSALADAGDFARIERLAAALARNFRRYRAFPPPTELHRFDL